MVAFICLNVVVTDNFTLFFGLVVTLMVLLFAGTRAQASAPELFISEYIEGSSKSPASHSWGVILEVS